MTNTISSSANQQPIQALELANRVRRARSELKARVAAGQVGAAEIIVTCPFGAGGMPIVKLLRSQRGWGDARCRAFLARAALHEGKPIGSLTERQRRAIASLLTSSASAPLNKAPQQIVGSAPIPPGDDRVEGHVSA
jgi:hypothetical protein